MKRVLILGYGYTGGYLYNSLKKDHDVEIVSKASLNYTDSDILETYLFEYKPDYVVNCSGYTGRPNVDGCEDNKEDCWKLNVTAPAMVNSACKAHNIPYIHISSGCVYSGYDKAWTEKDPANYGVFSNESSFYSKSKHAYELASSDYGLTIRIRMPFDDDNTDRSIVSKLLRYDKLIDPGKNSKTYMSDLTKFINKYISEGHNDNEIINFVNPEPLSTLEVTEIMKVNGMVNENWEIGVEFAELNTKTGRSNCTLDITKLKNKYSFEPLTEQKALLQALYWNAK